MELSVILYLLLLVIVALLRIFELRISRSHQKQMVADGASKVSEPRFLWMVLLHTAVLTGAALEVVFLHRHFYPVLGTICFVIFLAANAVRWWVIRTTGPFRYVRHPNYAAVFTEMLVLPLIHTAWITAIAGSLVHIVVLSQRLETEERVLFSDAHYREAMAGKPRFLPGLF